MSHPCWQRGAKSWNVYMEPKLEADVKQIVCISEDYRLDIEDYKKLLEDKTIVFVDYEKLQRDYNLVVTPTIVALDGQGTISHIQLSHSMGDVDEAGFDRELVELLTGSP